MTTLVYNTVLVAADLALLAALRRRAPTRVLLASLAALVAAALLGAPLLARLAHEGMFGLMRLASYAIFVHAPLLAFAAAALLRASARRAAAALAILGAVDVAVGVDAFLVEPRWLEISRVSLTSPKLRRPLRIVVLSDIQMDHFGDYERRAIDAVMAERPDLILMPGDYIQVGPPAERRAVREAFAAHLRAVGFNAPLGVYAVEGNAEEPGWPAIFDGLPITTFPTSSTAARGEIAITGLTLADSFNGAIRVPALDRFHIALGHAPDFSLGQVDADLLVAGHTHGGQVQLPFVGPLITLSAVPRAQAAGVTQLPGGRTLVVSRGVGMERGPAPRLRFLCRPEIVVIELKPAR